jgi:uncharacterized membrane protein
LGPTRGHRPEQMKAGKRWHQGLHRPLLSSQPSLARTTATMSIGALRFALRDERDLAEKFVRAVVVTFGLQDLQAVIVECASGGRFAFVGAEWPRGRVANCRTSRPARRPTGLPATLSPLVAPTVSINHGGVNCAICIADAVLFESQTINNNVPKVSCDFSTAEIDAGKIPEESIITS